MTQPDRRAGRGDRGRVVALPGPRTVVVQPEVRRTITEFEIVRIIDMARARRVVAMVRDVGMITVLDGDDYGRDWTYADIEAAVARRLELS